MADETQADRVLAAVTRSSGDLSHPEDLRPNIPQSVAEENSVKAANDAIRDLLRSQSGREADRAEEPKPRKRTASKSE